MEAATFPEFTSWRVIFPEPEHEASTDEAREAIKPTISPEPVSVKEMSENESSLIFIEPEPITEASNVSPSQGEVENMVPEPRTLTASHFGIVTVTKKSERLMVGASSLNFKTRVAPSFFTSA